MDFMDLHKERKTQRIMLYTLTLLYHLQDMYLIISKILYFHSLDIKSNQYGDEKVIKEGATKNSGNATLILFEDLRQMSDNDMTVNQFMLCNLL